MIGHELAAALPELRAHAESMMIDACLIERSTGKEMDPDTLEYVETWESAYDGKCRFKPRDVQGNDVTEGEREFYVGKAELQLPISAPLMPADLRVTLIDSPLDPAQVGRVMWTQDTEPRTHATKRTVSLSEVRDGAG